MKTTAVLLQAAQDIWQEYNRHPFVLGIQEGNLEKEKFKYYMIQDYLYLLEYTKTFAIGIAKAKSKKTTELFSSYVHLLTNSEMDIHKGYMGALGITYDQLYNTPVALDNLSYTSYMLRVAYEEGEAEILAAIISCAYSYEMIAKTMVKNKPGCIHHPFYGDWIKGYIKDSYSQANIVLMDMLDELTQQYTQQQIKHLTDIFVACSRYELAFWDLSWQLKK